MTREQAITEILQRLVAWYRPERVYLIGSAGPDSDPAFCVVVSDDSPATVFNNGAACTRLSLIGHPKDVNPWRASDFDALAAKAAESLPAGARRAGRRR
jgi:hypothetical protein